MELFFYDSNVGAGRYIEFVHDLLATEKVGESGGEVFFFLGEEVFGFYFVKFGFGFFSFFEIFGYGAEKVGSVEFEEVWKIGIVKIMKFSGCFHLLELVEEVVVMDEPEDFLFGGV